MRRLRRAVGQIRSALSAEAQRASPVPREAGRSVSGSPRWSSATPPPAPSPRAEQRRWDHYPNPPPPQHPRLPHLLRQRPVAARQASARSPAPLAEDPPAAAFPAPASPTAAIE